MEGNIRIYVSDADEAVRRLAQLDSRRPPTSQVLLAEVDGQPRAAKPLDGGPAFADPFHQTRDLLGLLELRVAQLQPVPERRLRLVAILSHAHRPARVPCKRQAVRRGGGNGHGAARAAEVGLGRRAAYARPGSERPSTSLAPGSTVALSGLARILGRKGKADMSRASSRLSCVVLLALAAFGASIVSAAARGGNPGASGHANLSVGDGQKRTFSFTAVRHRDGTVTGQAQVNNPSFPIRVHFAIDCLEFHGANRVIASGPVTHSSDPDTIAVGRISVFAVEDNGERANAAADRITTIPDYAPPRSCHDFSVSDSGLHDETSGALVRPWRAIEAGQIQVRP